MRSTPRPETITVSSVTGTVPPNGPHDPPVEDPTNTWHPQGAFYLNQIAPPPAPPKRWPGWKIALLVAALISPAVVFALVLTAVRSDPSDSSKTAPTLESAAGMCHEEVKKNLKAPGTAQFGTADFSTTVEGVPIRVSGWVDAQNSFGALVRNRYSCLATPSGSTWTISDVTFSNW